MGEVKECFLCGTSLGRGRRAYAKASTQLGQWEAVEVCVGCLRGLGRRAVAVCDVRGVRRLVEPYPHV